MELFDTHFHFDGKETFAEYLRRCYDDLAIAAEKLRKDFASMAGMRIFAGGKEW